jgi:hypothetical protein
MKKFLYILVGVIIVYLSSIVYRERVTPITARFPVERLGKDSRGEIRFNLILYFAMNNCRPCLKPVVDFLNEPRDKIRVIGIIPENEINLVSDVRDTTGASFPIYSSTKWRRYVPFYTPTLYGVGPDGNVYFILPCVGLEESYLSGYFDEFLRKTKRLFYDSIK